MCLQGKLKEKCRLSRCLILFKAQEQEWKGENRPRRYYNRTQISICLPFGQRGRIVLCRSSMKVVVPLLY